MNAISLILLLLFSPATFASNELNNAYQQGAQTGNSAVAGAENIVRNFSPEREIAGYNPNPKQTQYHTGTEQSFNKISAEGAQAARSSESGKAIYNSFDQRPLYRVDHQSQGMQRSTTISNNAANIAQGISNAYVDCKKTQECRTTYTEHTCQESGGLGDVSCTRELVVQAIPQMRVTQTVSLRTEGGSRIWERTGIRYESDFVIDLKTGQVLSRAPRELQVSTSPNLNPMPCDNLRVTYTSLPLYPRSAQPTVTLTQQPSCQNAFQAGFRVAGSGFSFYPFGAKIDLTVHATPPPEIREHWVDGCQQLEARQCTKLETQCTQANQTRTINDVPITRPCWQERVHYRCGQNSPNICTPLRERGCEQMGTRCLEQVGSQCLRHEQTFRCPKETCTGSIGVICNESKFCLQGDCTQAKPTPYNPNEAAKDLSALSGAADASKQFDVQIFKGRRQACRKISFGFLDCCADKGWGRDAGLARCNAEEKELGHNKEKKLVLEAGEYCSRRVAGICLQRSKTYCAFQSKLSKIVQQQGRIGQLGISLGGGENPDCRGLNPDELQRIDFEKIDFRDFYDDLRGKIKLPNEAEINQRMRDAIQRQQQSGRDRP